MRTAMLAQSQCRHGVFTHPINDTYIGRCLASYGEWSEGEVKLISCYLEKGSTAVEIGSNLGAHTVPMARMVGTDGTILAFEPQRLVFQLLCSNLIANEIYNVRVFNAAVGAQRGMTVVPDLDLSQVENFGATRINSKLGLRTPMQTVDDLSLEQLDFLKIDAEDCEADILLGAVKTIDKFTPTILIEYNPNQQMAINRVLKLFGQYRFFSFIERIYSPSNYNRSPDDLYPNIASFGLLACLGEPAQQARKYISFKEVFV